MAHSLENGLHGSAAKEHFTAVHVVQILLGFGFVGAQKNFLVLANEAGNKRECRASCNRACVGVGCVGVVYVCVYYGWDPFLVPW